MFDTHVHETEIHLHSFYPLRIHYIVNAYPLDRHLDNGKYDINPADIEKFAKPTQKAKIAEPNNNTNLINQMTTQIDRQVEEIAFLRDELSKQRDEQSEQSKRHDTIVLHMTQQLDRAQLQLEDKQNTPSLWQRLKTVFQNGY